MNDIYNSVWRQPYISSLAKQLDKDTFDIVKDHSLIYSEFKVYDSVFLVVRNSIFMAVFNRLWQKTEELNIN